MNMRKVAFVLVGLVMLSTAVGIVLQVWQILHAL